MGCEMLEKEVDRAVLWIYVAPVFCKALPNFGHINAEDFGFPL
jgi:hypothetical protein